MAEQKGKMLKKLTVRDLMGRKVAQVAQVIELLAAGAKFANGDGPKPAPVALCRIYGRTDKAKPGSSDLGEYVRFVGEFVGVNLLTGERMGSGSCILPGAAEANVYGSIGPLDERGHAKNTVEFAIEVYAVYDAESATGYVYEVRSLVEARASDPMQALLQLAGADKPALPSPNAGAAGAGAAAASAGGKAAEGSKGKK